MDIVTKTTNDYVLCAVCYTGIKPGQRMAVAPVFGVRFHEACWQRQEEINDAAVERWDMTVNR